MHTYSKAGCTINMAGEVRMHFKSGLFKNEILDGFCRFLAMHSGKRGRSRTRFFDRRQNQSRSHFSSSARCANIFGLQPNFPALAAPATPGLIRRIEN